MSEARPLGEQPKKEEDETTQIHVQARSDLDDDLFRCAGHRCTPGYRDRVFLKEITPQPALADAREGGQPKKENVHWNHRRTRSRARS